MILNKKFIVYRVSLMDNLRPMAPDFKTEFKPVYFYKRMLKTHGRITAYMSDVRFTSLSKYRAGKALLLQAVYLLPDGGYYL
jgi:hypothetical protein